MKTVKETVEDLMKWGTKEVVPDKYGAKLVCHRSDIAPKAYMHTVLGPLEEDYIQDMRKSYIHTFPEELMEFYRVANGMWLFKIDLFTKVLAIYGYRHWVYSDDESIEPVDLRFSDLDRPKKCPKRRLFFGAYMLDDPTIRMFFNADGVDKKVYACMHGSNEILKEWDSFEEWFVTEVERLSKLFDRKTGKLIATPEDCLPF